MGEGGKFLFKQDKGEDQFTLTGLRKLSKAAAGLASVLLLLSVMVKGVSVMGLGKPVRCLKRFVKE